MKKLLSLLGVGVLVAMWSGCGVTDPASSVTITIDGIGAVAIGGGAGQVTGKIETDSVLTLVTMKVLSGSTDVTSKFTVSFTSAYQGKKSADLKTDMSTTITALSTATAATYTLSITAEAGSITSTSTKDFAVTGNGGTLLTEATATLGNTLNTEPGSIDLDNGSRYTTLEVTLSNAGSIDLCFANGSNIDRFYVPEAAKYGTTDNKTIKTTAAGFNFTDTWPLTGYASAVRINTITSAQYDATTTAQAAAALWDAGNALVFAPVTAVDNAYLVKTSSSAYVLVKVTALVAGTSGTVSFKYAK